MQKKIEISSMLWFTNIFASIDGLWLDFRVSVSSKQLDNFAGGSTSLPGGNQVNGSPLAFSFKSAPRLTFCHFRPVERRMLKI